MATKGYFLQDSSALSTSLQLLSTTGGIDGKSLATTNLYTVPTGKSAIPIFFVVRPTAQVDLNGTGLVTFGVAGGDDIIGESSTSFFGGGQSCAFFVGVSGNRSRVPLAGEIITVTIAEIFPSTSVTLAIDTWGYLF